MKDIEVKIDGKVYAVRTWDDARQVETVIHRILREEESRIAAEKAAALEAKRLTEGWVRVPGGLCYYIGFHWRVIKDWWSADVRPPVALWTRNNQKSAWHLIAAGDNRSRCSWSVPLSEGMEVSVPEPLDKVCSQCVKRGGQ